MDERHVDAKNKPVKKKTYLKPTLEIIELRSEERIAGSGNCAACRGNHQCAPGGNPGGPT